MQTDWSVYCGVVPRNTVPVQDRVIDAASVLFAASGVRAVGVDRIIAEAGVAKASFYRHFPSKDDVVVAWLRSPAARWLDPVRAEVDHRAGDGGERLLTFLEVVGELVARPGYSGCPYLNVAAELHEAPRGVRDVLEGFASELREWIRSLVLDAGFSDAEGVAAECRLVVVGSMSITVLLADGGEAARAGLDAFRRRVTEVT